MKIVRTLAVTAGEFFDCLEGDLGESELYEGMPICRDARGGAPGQDILILEYDRGTVLRMEVTDADGAREVCYEVEPGDGRGSGRGVTVTFTETPLDGAAADGMTPSLEAGRLGQMSEELMGIQSRIEQARKGRRREDPRTMNPTYWLVDAIMRRRAKKDPESYRIWSRFKDGR